MQCERGLAMRKLSVRLSVKRVDCDNLPLIWLRQTAQPYTCYTTYNSLPRRTATIYNVAIVPAYAATQDSHNNQV